MEIYITWEEKKITNLIEHSIWFKEEEVDGESKWKRVTGWIWDVYVSYFNIKMSHMFF